MHYLFELFGELKNKKELQRVKDLGIGVGLSNSKELCSSLGGSVRLVSTKEGHTEFEIIIPIFNYLEVGSPLKDYNMIEQNC